MPIFSHRSGSYLLDRANRENWIAQRVVSGGIMDRSGLAQRPWRRWRSSLLVTAGLFGYAHGTEWGVNRYRMNGAG